MTEPSTPLQQPVNHPSHWFAETWDGDTIRCADCEVLYGGLRSGQPCPAAATRLDDRRRDWILFGSNDVSTD